jgi:periplasmic copper chaperone A
MSKMHRITYLAAAALAFGTASAQAHVTIQPKQAAADSYVQVAFTVPHGCDGSATVAIRVKLPDGVGSVKPQMKPGWTVEIKTRKLETPQAVAHGKAISEAVDEVSWRGGPLPDSLFDSFGLVLKLPDTPGKNLYFPVVQECEQGVHRWIEIPADGKADDKLHEPAPVLQLTPKAP